MAPTRITTRRTLIRGTASRTTGRRPYVSGDITLTTPTRAHLTATTARVGSPADSSLASDLGVDGATGGAVMVTAGAAGVDTAAGTMAEEPMDLEVTAATVARMRAADMPRAVDELMADAATVEGAALAAATPIVVEAAGASVVAADIASVVAAMAVVDSMVAVATVVDAGNIPSNPA